MMMQYYLKPTKLTNGGKDVGAYYGTCDYNIEYNDNNRPTLPIGSLLITYICGKPLTPPYFIAYDFLRYDKILYSDPCMSSDDEAVQTAKIAEYIKLKTEEDSFSSQKFKAHTFLYNPT
jgi:hypothetical protein